MIDRKKVLKGLMLHADESGVYVCDKCPYYENEYCSETLSKDALALLKAQESVKPQRDVIYPQNYWCTCGWYLGIKNMTNNYCPYCGRKVAWD